MNFTIPHYPGITSDTHNLRQKTFFPLCSFDLPLTIALELEGERQT